MRVDNDEQTDDWLMQQYVKSRDQEAFAILVERYGPMVWGVCQRIVRHTHDAEDALQATFAVPGLITRFQHRSRELHWLRTARRLSPRQIKVNSSCSTRKRDGAINCSRKSEP